MKKVIKLLLVMLVLVSCENTDSSYKDSQNTTNVKHHGIGTDSSKQIAKKLMYTYCGGLNEIDLIDSIRYEQNFSDLFHELNFLLYNIGFITKTYEMDSLTIVTDTIIVNERLKMLEMEVFTGYSGDTDVYNVYFEDEIGIIQFRSYYRNHKCVTKTYKGEEHIRLNKICSDHFSEYIVDKNPPVESTY